MIGIGLVSEDAAYACFLYAFLVRFTATQTPNRESTRFPMFNDVKHRTVTARDPMAGLIMQLTSVQDSKNTHINLSRTVYKAPKGAAILVASRRLLGHTFQEKRRL